MKPDRKIPEPVHSLETRHIRHFITTGKMILPYREQFHIILRRFRSGGRAIHSRLVIDIRHYMPQH